MKTELIDDNPQGFDYKRIHCTEGFGGILKRFGIRVYVSIDRELTQDEIWEIRLLAEKATEFIASETVKLDPETEQTNKENKATIISLFKGKDIFVDEIPNGYCPNDTYYKQFPWYRITTKLGHFVIGWRKKVLVINYNETLIESEAEYIFPMENTTKELKSIHAWSYEKAQEYISRLFEVANVS